MNIELNKAQKMLEWLKTKMYLECITENAKNRSVKRGQVYRCNFGCGIGSEMGKDRPAVIVQKNGRQPIHHKVAPCWMLGVVLKGRAYFAYWKSGQFEWAAPAILFACLVFTLTAPAYVRTIPGS